MPRRRLLVALLLGLLSAGWLVGCSTPQTLSVDPRRSSSVPESGSGQEVTVMAVDDRDGEVIGTRSGSAMSTATITVHAHELVPRLQREAERAVREMGFTPTTEPAEGHPSLTLTLKRLGYERGDGQPVIGEARMEAVFVAEAINGGDTYTGTYTSRRTQGYALRPDQEANTRMIQALLGDGLDRAFRDPDLGRLLAR